MGVQMEIVDYDTYVTKVQVLVGLSFEAWALVRMSFEAWKSVCLSFEAWE